MQYNITKPLKRQYNLLMLLLNNLKPQLKQDVAKRICCSRPTLDSTINYANELIKGYGEIIFEGDGLELKLKKNFSQRQLKGLVVKETVCYSFLYDLFFCDIISIEQWSLKHFVSPSSTYKHIKEIDGFLTLMNIHLKNGKQGLYLAGNEWQIRYLYLKLLRDVSMLDNKWPFSDFDYSKILSIVQLICREADVYLGPILEYQFALFIGVHLTRAQNSKASYDYQMSERKMAPYLEAESYKKVANKLLLTTKVNLSEVEIAMIISSLEIFPMYYLSVQTRLNRIDFAKKYDQKYYRFALDSMSILENSRNETSEVFVKYLDALTPLEFIPFFQEISLNNFDVVIRDNLRYKEDLVYLEKVLVIEGRVEKLADNEFFKRNRDYILEKLYLLYTTRVQAYRRNEPVVVTVVSQLGPIQEEVYAQKLTEYFSDLHMQIINSSEVHLQDLWGKIDLIIGDFDMSGLIPMDNMVIIDEQLTRRSLIQIDKMIKERNR